MPNKYHGSGNFLIILAVPIRLWRVSGFTPSLTNNLFFLSSSSCPVPQSGRWFYIVESFWTSQLLPLHFHTNQKNLPSETEKFKLFSTLQHPVTLQGARVQCGNEGDKVPFLEQAADPQISPRVLPQHSSSSWGNAAWLLYGPSWLCGSCMAPAEPGATFGPGVSCTPSSAIRSAENARATMFFC